MENKVYGPKPSYKFMKEIMKENNSTSFGYHGQNLVYYCIKHDLNEEEVNNYLDNEIEKCSKYLENHCAQINFYVDYHIYKDIINTNKEDFTVKVIRDFVYDYKQGKYINEIKDWQIYNWKNNLIRFNSPENRYLTFFRQKSEHTKFFEEIFKRNGNCNCPLQLLKYESKNPEKDIVQVKFFSQAFHSKKFLKEICLEFWHFIKMLDCVQESDYNDININELYKKFDSYNIFEDRTKWRKIDK